MGFIFPINTLHVEFIFLKHKNLFTFSSQERQPFLSCIVNTMVADALRPLLLTLINFNPSVDK